MKKLIYLKHTSTTDKCVGLGYLALIVVAFAFIHKPVLFQAVFMLAACYFWFLNRCNSNISSLLMIILGAKTLEYGLFQMVEDSSNYVVFSSYFLIDIPVVLMIVFRVPLSRMMDYRETGYVNKNKYVITSADLYLGKLYIIYCLVNLLALIEHGLRHLDDFGFPSDAIYVQALYDNARFIWNNYEVFKHTLNVLEFIVVMSTVTNYVKSRSVVQA